MSDAITPVGRTPADDYRELIEACVRCEQKVTTRLFVSAVHSEQAARPWIRGALDWQQFLDTEIRLRRLADGLPS